MALRTIDIADDTTEDLDTDGAKNSAKDAYSTGKDIAKKIKDSANKKDDEDGEEGASKSKKGGSFTFPERCRILQIFRDIEVTL